MKVFRKLVTPYVVWMSLFIVFPMFLILMYSITSSGNSTISLQFTLENFAKFFDPVFFKVLWVSIRVAFITTLICLVVGYPLAYSISKTKPKTQTLLILLVTIPMWINMLVRTYAWVSILADNGLLNSLLGLFGIAPIKMMFTDFAVILGMVYNFLPFMIMQIYNVLAKMEPSLEEAAHDLGANPFQTFWRIVFPLSLPGVITGITLVFLPTLSTFVIPKLLGGGSYVLIGNLIENQFINIGDYHFGSAISLIMAMLIMLSTHFASKLDRGSDGLKTKGGKL